MDQVFVGMRRPDFCRRETQGVHVDHRFRVIDLRSRELAGKVLRASGIVAGIIMDAYEAVMNGMVLAPRWAAIVKSLGLPAFAPTQIMLFNIVGLVTGLIAVWTYAAIRPRFGIGVKTAIYAAGLTWVTAYALAVDPAGLLAPRRVPFANVPWCPSNKPV